MCVCVCINAAACHAAAVCCAHTAGIIRRAAEHILAHVDAVKQKLKPGEAISVRAYALELYNEELRDLSSFSAATAAAAAAAVAAAGPDEAAASSSIRLSERPVGNGRCIPEVRPGGNRCVQAAVGCAAALRAELAVLGTGVGKHNSCRSCFERVPWQAAYAASIRHKLLCGRRVGACSLCCLTLLPDAAA